MLQLEDMAVSMTNHAHEKQTIELTDVNVKGKVPDGHRDTGEKHHPPPTSTVIVSENSIRPQPAPVPNDGKGSHT